MKPDDPKLTAYALGELDPAEQAEIEKLLRDDRAAQAEVEEVRAFAAQLRDQLHAEPAESLSETQRARVMRAAANVQPASAGEIDATPRRRVPWMRIAAGLVLCGIVAAVMFPSISAVKENARRPAAVYHSVPLPAAESARGDASGRDSNADQFRSRYAANSLAFELKQPFVLPKDETAGLEEKLQAPAAGEPMVATTTATAGSKLELSLGTTVAPLPAPAATPSPDAFLAFAPRPASEEAAGGAAASMGRRARAASDKAKSDSGSLVASNDIRTRVGREIDTTSSRHGGKVLRDNLASAPLDKARGLAKNELDGRMGAFKENVSELNTLSGAVRYEERDRKIAELKGMERESSEFRVTREKHLMEEEKIRQQDEPSNTESYDAITDNPFLDVRGNPLSTFSIDVDTASYANVRRFLNDNQRPPRGAVRIEELVNYFTYDYPQPEPGQPFSAKLEVATCPWKPEHRLLRVGLKGREIPRDQRPPGNLVFLIDVSGSMEPANKLPLVKECLRLLTNQLGEDDRVSIAVYAGASGCVLEPTRTKQKIRDAIDRLEAGGSTNGASGIQLAFELAQRAFIRGGTNRVILCTDGDFNVGVTSQSALVDLVRDKAKTGIFLSVLGFGMGNLKDSTLEKLADKGNGNYAYIDTLAEGRRVLVEQMAGTLVTIAKDVKIQVEFNPAQVGAYRLIGYENRLLAKEDFNDDTKDAGEIGAGHTVTALYEIVPAGQPAPAAAAAVDPLKYQESGIRGQESGVSRELLTLKLRWKAPDGEASTLREFPLTDAGATWEKSSRDFRFAAAVAGFGMMLRESPHRGNATWDSLRELAVEGRGEDRDGYRAEFIALLDKAKALARK